MIRVAMLSFWHVHGRDYARAAEEHPETEIVAVWDENPERGHAEAVARHVPFFARLDDLLAQPDIDAVIVDSPTSMHHEVMIAAARAGKHILRKRSLLQRYARLRRSSRRHSRLVWPLSSPCAVSLIPQQWVSVT